MCTNTSNALTGIELGNQLWQKLLSAAMQTASHDVALESMYSVL
jgi:hypothetical protein